MNKKIEGKISNGARKLLKPYDPKTGEKKVYETWEKSGFFNPDNLPRRHKKPFTIVMPPPNVTGVLHMGHALMLTLEDIMIRYKRMRGYKTLWLPGTDHAAIATQSKVEKDIYKNEKKTRHDLGREEFLSRVEKFAKASHDTIVEQIKVMGASCDWSREAFTLDEKRNRAVNEMFKRMHSDGLIYRGHRIVNWDPKGQTTISDDEVVYEDRMAILYTFRYSKDFPIAIATTRPETKVGDVAVAVHPNDVRYKKYVGKEYDLEFCGVPLHIKIVADGSVEQEFGTGAVGITPAHSMTDWEIALRHSLPTNRQVINEYARMTVGGNNFLNKKTTEAREKIVRWLKEEKLLSEEKEIPQRVATAERTGGIVEPLPKLQWFVAVDKEIPGRGETLKQIMRKPVAAGEINIIPEHLSKTYFHWIDNLRDWCISRQIWYGHRIPVWYKKTKLGKPLSDGLLSPQIYIGVNPPKDPGWEQDPDTLDTWFSSGLWTFSTLGWPEKTKDLEIYHPTDILETGYEILFFWVARMILSSGYALRQIPFRTVYLHGTIRDQKGRKMSKSLDNGIDPIDVAEKYGADAGRMALVIGNTPGTDAKIWEDKIRGYKHFTNKLWNVARFVLENTKNIGSKKIAVSKEDTKIKKELMTLLKEVTDDMEECRFYLAGEKLYHYLWHTFADKILEESKIIFQNKNEKEKLSRRQVLYEMFLLQLKALHPFIPFVTEAIWTLLPKEKRLLMIEEWPV